MPCIGGVMEVVIEKATGVAARPEIDALVASLASGDVLAITEVSRLGRTATEVLLNAESLEKCGIHLRILNLGIDTATPAGGLVLTVMADLAKYERELMKECVAMPRH